MAEGKSRHGCLTALLVVMIIANSASALMYLLGSEAMRAEHYPTYRDGYFPL